MEEATQRRDAAHARVLEVLQRKDDLRFLRDLIERVNDAKPEVVGEGEYLRASNITCALWKENEGRAPMPHRGVESAVATLLHVAARARQ